MIYNRAITKFWWIHETRNQGSMALLYSLIAKLELFTHPSCINEQNWLPVR